MCNWFYVYRMKNEFASVDVVQQMQMYLVLVVLNRHVYTNDEYKKPLIEIFNQCFAQVPWTTAWVQLKLMYWNHCWSNFLTLFEAGGGFNTPYRKSALRIQDHKKFTISCILFFISFWLSSNVISMIIFQYCNVNMNLE